MRAFAAYGIWALLAVTLPAPAVTQSHTFSAPDTVYAALDGTFSYEWLLTVGAGGTVIAGAGWDGGENVQGGEHGDCFCVPEICTLEEGETLTWTVVGRLTNAAHSGTTQNWVALCDISSFGATTTVLPARPTAVEERAWSRVKRLFR